MTAESVENVRTAPSAGELRTGNWTRLGDKRVLGDSVTEQMLSGIAERARAAAQAQGYSVGWSEGRRAAQEKGRAELARIYAEATRQEERRQAEHQELLRTLRAAVDEVRSIAGQVAGQVESQATELALGLAAVILDRELAVAENPGADAVRRALRLLPDESLVTIHMNPDDLHRTDVSSLTDLGATAVADGSLAPGDVVVVADDHVVDGRVGAALARAREVFGA